MQHLALYPDNEHPEKSDVEDLMLLGAHDSLAARSLWWRLAWHQKGFLSLKTTQLW